MPPDPLLVAAISAMAFLREYHDELLESYCTPNPDGTPRRDTADAIESEHLDEVRDLIETLHLAIIEKTQAPTLLDLIGQTARDPSVDVETFDALLTTTQRTPQ
jgi:hypothetical protein